MIRIVPKQSESPHTNFVYIPRTTIRGVLLEYLSNPEFKEKLANMDATIVAKCSNLETKANVEEFVVGNIPFGDESLSTTNHKDPEHVMPEQDDAPTPYNYDE